jgi:hypothetical protein
MQGGLTKDTTKLFKVRIGGTYDKRLSYDYEMIDGEYYSSYRKKTFMIEVKHIIHPKIFVITICGLMVHAPLRSVFFSAIKV